ncbi:unnamed protein product [Phytophthora fragariaefolia]|uniref:Histone-lysine N-methyltransferase, H3 lysine-79 specific n=1 Tax=Phytophthora fragariaefolia TaxID=1490495 RepID=A0A9W6YGZ9_9STRA|nr:unnamed protein product [Phytophthora fragariaefolia]
MGDLFRAISQQQGDPRRRDPDQHKGEISEVGVTSMLYALSELKTTGIFLDVGSGIGDVIAQVALESIGGVCVGVEVQRELAELSKRLVTSAKAFHVRLTKICVHDDDIRQLRNTTTAAMQSSTIVFLNNLVFDPSSNLALETFVTRASILVHVITMDKWCGRHRQDYKRPFCAV